MDLNECISQGLREYPEVRALIDKEARRQEKNIELIASENFAPESVRLAVASCLCNKYSEGYPALERHSGNKGRYYGGCEVAIDPLEEMCCNEWRKVFNTDYHVNVQAHSGSQANYAAYSAVCAPGDTILAMSMDAGSHLTHASPVALVSKIYNVETYGLNDDYTISHKDLYRKVIQCKPKLVIVGASAYSYEIDYEAIREEVVDASILAGIDIPYMLADIAHPAGLIASGLLQSPFDAEYDLITTTTHKTLRGNRGGLIFCMPELAKKVDSAVFPKNQGGPLQNEIAGKLITAIEDQKPEYKQYCRQVMANTSAMAAEFSSLGYDIVGGHTENHLFMIDLRSKFPEMTGKEAQDVLDSNYITLNKNCVPNESRSPMLTSGVRIGCAAMTTKGYKEEDFVNCAHKIDKILTDYYNKKVANNAE